MKIAAIILSILFIHLLINLARLFSVKRYYKMFRSYRESYYRSYGNASKRILIYSESIRRLFDKAGTNHKTVLRINRKIFNRSVSECICDPTSFDEVDNTFLTTTSVYRTRCFNTINPLYWFELPLRIIKKLNIKTSRTANICLSILSWLLSVIAAFFVEKFLDSQTMREFAEKVCHMIK